MKKHELVGYLTDAIQAHSAWKMKMLKGVESGHLPQTASEIRCSQSCMLGKWLNGPHIDAAMRQGTPYKVVSRVHGEFHEAAAHVATLIEAGRSADAKAALDGPFRVQAEKMVGALRKWRDEAQAQP